MSKAREYSGTRDLLGALLAKRVFLVHRRFLELFLEALRLAWTVCDDISSRLVTAIPIIVSAIYTPGSRPCTTYPFSSSPRVVGDSVAHTLSSLMSNFPRVAERASGQAEQRRRKRSYPLARHRCAFLSRQHVTRYHFRVSEGRALESVARVQFPDTDGLIRLELDNCVLSVKGKGLPEHRLEVEW